MSDATPSAGRHLRLHRACRRLGFGGYQELKIAAARQAPREAEPAADAAYRLRALGLPVDLPPDPLTAHLAAGLLPGSSVCLAISHSGATRSTVDAPWSAGSPSSTRPTPTGRRWRRSWWPGRRLH